MHPFDAIWVPVFGCSVQFLLSSFLAHRVGGDPDLLTGVNVDILDTKEN
jgi:hypothetical protein